GPQGSIWGHLMAMTFETVKQVQDLRDHYWLLEEACERLNAREPRSHFAPDLYADILEGRARAVLGFVKDQPIGFFVTRPGHDSEGRPALLVWVAYTRPGTPPEALLA